MTRLTVFNTKSPSKSIMETEEFSSISKQLISIGAHIERWPVDRQLAPNPTSDDILFAFAPEIERLKSERGYATADVVQIKLGDPNWPAMRQKFLAEHIHDEDEVRFFVEGTGAFYLHVGDEIYQVIGEVNDLLSVPRGTKHWFDGGPDGFFTVIRLFSDKNGWVAHFTGDPIAESVPTFHVS